MRYTSQNVERVVRRINDAIMRDGKPPDMMPVSDEEYADCTTAVLAQLADARQPLAPYTRHGRGILFKNVEIYPE